VTIKDPVAISARNSHTRCLLCGSLNPLSLKLSFQADDKGVVKARFQSHHLLQGYNDIIHGGVIAALLDAAMTHCLFHHGIQGLTADLHVRYVHPVSCDATLDIRAEILSSLPPLYRLKAEALHENRVMAWAEAKFMQRGRPR
jgi:uncharacterized protein (TIGR00369 family)